MVPKMRNNYLVIIQRNIKGVGITLTNTKVLFAPKKYQHY